MIGHGIHKNLEYFDMLKNFNLALEMFVFYAISYSLIYLLLLFLIDLSKRVHRTKEPKSVFASSLVILRRFLGDGHPLSAIGIFLLCVNLYLGYTLLFIGNNIKTEAITIDTSDILTNSYAVFRSQRAFCFLKHETEMKIALNSPKGIEF